MKLLFEMKEKENIWVEQFKLYLILQMRLKKELKKAAKEKILQLLK